MSASQVRSVRALAGLLREGAESDSGEAGVLDQLRGEDSRRALRARLHTEFAALWDALGLPASADFRAGGLRWGSSVEVRIWTYVRNRRVRDVVAASLAHRRAARAQQSDKVEVSDADFDDEVTAALETGAPAATTDIGIALAGYDRLLELRDLLESLDTGVWSYLIEVESAASDAAGAASTAEPPPQSVAPAEQPHEATPSTAQPSEPSTSRVSTAPAADTAGVDVEAQLLDSSTVAKYAGGAVSLESAVGLGAGHREHAVAQYQVKNPDKPRTVVGIDAVLYEVLQHRIAETFARAGIRLTKRSSNGNAVPMSMVVNVCLAMILRAGGTEGVTMNEHDRLLEEVITASGDLERWSTVESHLGLMGKELVRTRKQLAQVSAAVTEVAGLQWAVQLGQALDLGERLRIVRVPGGMTGISGIDTAMGDPAVVAVANRVRAAALDDIERRSRDAGRPGSVRYADTAARAQQRAEADSETLAAVLDGDA